MKPAGRLLPLLCVLVASIALPAGARASAGHPSLFPHRSAEVNLRGTHGYRIGIQATSEEVYVTAKKGLASVSYVTFGGGLKGDRIDARLPGVGRILLHFHERGRSHRRQRADCASAQSIRQGVFVGLVKIRGERDYTSAESQHVRGKIVREHADGCRRHPTASASSGSTEFITASSDRGPGLLTFGAFAFPLTKLETDQIFVASFLHVRGKMAVINSQSALREDAGPLEISTPPRSATVDPPSPFTGSATFQQESAKDFSWTGDLAVELPGIGEVTLAGPKFETALCLGRRCRGDEESSEGAGSVAIISASARAAAPTPSPWRWPGSPR